MMNIQQSLMHTVHHLPVGSVLKLEEIMECGDENAARDYIIAKCNGEYIYIKIRTLVGIHRHENTSEFMNVCDEENEVTFASKIQIVAKEDRMDGDRKVYPNESYNAGLEALQTMRYDPSEIYDNIKDSGLRIDNTLGPKQVITFKVV
jgi:hypothetical protein